MAKVLVFSDLHLNNWSYGSRLINGYNSRLLAQRNVLTQIAARCKKDNIGTVVFNGDLFHKKGTIDPSVLKVAYEGFSEIAEAVDEMFILVGNHDTNRRDMAVHSLHWMNSLTGTKVIDKPYEAWCGYMLPFTDNEETLKEWMATVGSSGVHYVFMHQGVQNVKVGSDFVVPDEIFSEEMLPSSVRRAFTGHYHTHAHMPRITVVGSPMQHDWSDSGIAKGCLAFDTRSGEVEWHPLRAPKFVKYSKGDQVEGNFIRVPGTYKGDKDALRDALIKSGAESVDFELKIKPVAAFSASFKGFATSEVMEEFCTNNKVPEQTKIVGYALKDGSYEAPAA